MVHARHGFERIGERFGIAANLAARTYALQVCRDLSTSLMLREEDFDELFVGATVATRFREDVLVLEHLLAILFAELLEQLGGFRKSASVQLTQVRSAEPFAQFRIDNQRAPQYPMLAHEVLGRRDILTGAILSPVRLGGLRRRIGWQQSAPCIHQHSSTQGGHERDGAAPIQIFHMQHVGSLSALAPPRRLVLLLVIAERFLKTTEDLGRRFEHGLELGFVDFLHVLAKMIRDLLQAALHFLGMVSWVFFLCCLGWHEGLLHWVARIKLDQGERRAMERVPTATSTIGQVFLIFLRLGLTSFGGPLAHLGYFREEFVSRRQWFDDRSYADLVALCQFLAGPASSQVGWPSACRGQAMALLLPRGPGSRWPTHHSFQPALRRPSSIGAYSTLQY
jgi:hypothetical protein